MIRVGICDEKKATVEQMEELILSICKREGIKAKIDRFLDGATLEESYWEGMRYDLLYLDIQLGHSGGIAVAKSIRRVDENAVIIFVSSYDKCWMELFRLDVFAFIKKPIDSDHFTKMFLEAHEKISRKEFYFCFHYKGEEHKIPCNEILYFESRGRQIRFYMRSGETEMFNGKLSEVVDRLEKGKVPFLRIHQSYLVNYHFIRSRSKTHITLVNGKRLPISKERQKGFDGEYCVLLGEGINA
ncbi:MAG: LytR/AlgR family response regulator transcription factor [Roseburia sp.]